MQCSLHCNNRPFILCFQKCNMLAFKSQFNHVSVQKHFFYGMKNVHKCTFKLHAGENRYLERLWLLAAQFGSQTSRINYHLGACRKYRLLGPALCSLNQNQPLSRSPSVIQTGPEAFCLRPSELSCQMLAEVSPQLLFFPGIYICWSASLFTFHQDYKKYLYGVSCAFFFSLT